MSGNQFPIANSLWNILIRSRFKPILLCGDIEKAFLQIRIRESEKDVLRFHWIKNSDPSYRLHPLTVHTWRYFKEHFQYYINEYPTLIAAISEDMYIDDLVSGSNTIEETLNIQQKSLNKNPLSYFETLDLICLSGTQIYIHYNLPVQNLKLNLLTVKREKKKPSEFTKILRVSWDKNRDNLSIVIPEFNKKLLTKRSVSSYIASIYDPLGLISASHVIGKVICRKLCDKKLTWDTEIPQILKEKFLKWVNDISNILTEISRSIPTHKEAITSVALHIFRDGSIVAYYAAVYAVVNKPSAISQGLVASKSRISKRDLTIPRLELVSTHMACNLISNEKPALKNQKVRSVTGWTDSNVVLRWLNEQGSYPVHQKQGQQNFGKE